ncbi:MAG TPA: 50S ribosomal protein L28 [Dehalococcoidia bacterium]|nr:50S ribosomal protein L28 [Dehalococcoidia bacterium]
MKCDICGKRVQFGNNVSHSKKRVKRRWLPNIHRVTVTINSEKRRINMCTRCFRTQYKAVH